MIIANSPALKLFKKEVGQANHMLITILVGLDGIIGSDIEIKKEFHAAWSPKDKVASANRGKAFARRSSLVWMVDCLDMYLRLINREPSPMNDTDLKNVLDSPDNNRSVHSRLTLICQKYEIDSVRYALADMLVCWRNRLTHYDADNDITAANRKVLTDNRKFIEDEYSGLDINLTLASFDDKRAPTFKEVASLISASINLVYAIDKMLISRADAVHYADKVLIDYLRKDASKRLNELFSNENEKIYKSLIRILAQSGFAPGEEGETDVDAFCRNLSEQSFQEIKTKFNGGTFKPAF